MTKQEFLSALRGQITGSMPTSEVESQINYYEAFIDGQMNNGKSEEEAIAELGDPRLIAKTLIESTNRAAEAAGYDGPYRSSTDSYDDSDGVNSGVFGQSTKQPNETFQRDSSGNYRQTGSQNAQRTNTQSQNASRTSSSGTGCGGIIVVLIIILALIGLLVFSILRFTFRNLGTILIIVGIVVGVVFLVRLIRGRR